MKMRVYKGRGFVIIVRNERGDVVAEFTAARDHNAEAMLRGLVHEGYKVEVYETVIEKALPDYEAYEREMYTRNTEGMAVPAPMECRSY
jgi:hypothetical protein